MLRRDGPGDVSHRLIRACALVCYGACAPVCGVLLGSSSARTIVTGRWSAVTGAVSPAGPGHFTGSRSHVPLVVELWAVGTRCRVKTLWRNSIRGTVRGFVSGADPGSAASDRRGHGRVVAGELGRIQISAIGPVECYKALNRLCGNIIDDVESSTQRSRSLQMTDRRTMAFRERSVQVSRPYPHCPRRVDVTIHGS